MSRKNWTNEEIFKRVLTNKTQKTYWDNVLELRKRPCLEVFNSACSLAKSENDKEKIIGVDILAQLGYNPRFNEEGAIKLFFELLNKNQSPKVLENILYAIGHNNKNLDNDHLLKLIEFKNHRYSDVRYSLVHSLMGLGNNIAIETLIELSNDKHPRVRDWATFAIGSQIEITDEKIIKALWNRINDSDRITRQEAISGLAKRKDKRIKEILIKELEIIDEYGSSILESIEALNDMDFIVLLENQIEKNRTTGNVNEHWLINCIENLKTNASHRK